MTTYKRLGDYIREVDVRNKDLQCTNLLGLSIAKKFIPSIANMVGTDLKSYKIVKHNQFAYVPVTSRNGEKITVALYTDDEPAIISQAYVVFEIVGTCDTVETVCTPSLQCDQLLPEYLMMWFRRAEFDRYARYHSHGSAREVFDWEEMCNVMLPVPPIEEQRSIVNRYKAIENRIANNKQTIAKLEEAAQALYRKMFVDGIDVENLPEGWRMGTIGEVCEIFTGKKDVNETSEDGEYAFFSCSPTMYKSNEYIYDGAAVLVAGNGSYTGRVSYFNGKFDLYQRTYACIIKANVKSDFFSFVYSHMKFQFEPKYLGGSRGSSIPYIVRGDIADFPICINEERIIKYATYMDSFMKHMDFCSKENEKLTEMLSVMACVKR